MPSVASHHHSGHDPSEQAGHSPETDSQPSSHHHPNRGRHVDEYSQVMRSFQPTSNPLTAFVPKPLQTRFATQDREEQLILLLRRHPITQVVWILVAIIAALVPVFLNPGYYLSFLPGGYVLAIIVTWYLAVLSFVFQSFLSWYYNVYIITDERVIDVDFISLLYRNITSAKLNNIEDVTATAGGALQTVFDYGKVTVQTAGAKPEIEFDDVPRPNTIVQLFNELLLEEEQETIEGRAR